MTKITTALDYVSGASILPAGAFGISPSNIYKFFDKPHEWFREQILGEEGFKGSTSSVLGTCVHFCAEQYSKYGTVDVDQIFKYIYKETCSNANEEYWGAVASFTGSQEEREEGFTNFILNNCDNPDIDAQTILDQWKPMGQTVINHLYTEGVPQRSEELIKAQIPVENLPLGITPPDDSISFFASGSCDAVLNDSVLIDYKTTSDKTPKNYIPMHYRYQLLTYAYIYNKMGIPVDRIRIIWVTRNETNRISEKTNKPMKDYPSQAVAVTEQITEQDLLFIESILKLISETVYMYKLYPQLAYTLFKDYRLKEQN